jgi:ubiquinone/menaquinone biosynthesis C-methylase UbiE
MKRGQKTVAVFDEFAKEYAEEFTKPSEYTDVFLSLIKRNGKILDVGCGCGIDANYICSKGFTTIGIDVSKEMVRLAKKSFPKIEFKVKDMRKLVFSSDSFDGILVAYSLNYIPKIDVLRTLKLLHRFLKKGGIIYIALQSGKSQEIFVTEPLKPSIKILLDIFSENEINSVLQESGFSPVRRYRRKSKSREELGFVKFFVIARKKA